MAGSHMTISSKFAELFSLMFHHAHQYSLIIVHSYFKNMMFCFLSNFYAVMSFGETSFVPILNWKRVQYRLK